MGLAKKPLAIIFNDAHLKTGNEEAVVMAVKYLISFAVKNNIRNIIFAGDLFDSRSFQRQSVLEAFDKILAMFEEAGCILYLFPGNHDKTLYSSAYSFLDIYRHHPCVRFNRELTKIDINGVDITLLPFFSDDKLIPMLEEAEGGDVLISHFEMAGSTHLGKVSQKSSINRKLLSKWKKVYLGHYHNWHEITKDIVHLPSLIQASFGEDSKKGFTVLYEDLSYELIKGHFREYKLLSFDVEELTPNKIKDIIESYGKSEDVVRLSITGKESRLKAFDKSVFDGQNIDVKIKYDFQYEIDLDNLEYPKVTEVYGKEDIFTAFKAFCDNKGYEYEAGIKLLNKFFKKDE